MNKMTMKYLTRRNMIPTKIVIRDKTMLLTVRFLSFKQYDIMILFERITCTPIITRDKRHKDFP